MTYISLPHGFLTWKGEERNHRGKKETCNRRKFTETFKVNRCTDNEKLLFYLNYLAVRNNRAMLDLNFNK